MSVNDPNDVTALALPAVPPSSSPPPPPTQAQSTIQNFNNRTASTSALAKQGAAIKQGDPTASTATQSNPQLGGPTKLKKPLNQPASPFNAGEDLNPSNSTTPSITDKVTDPVDEFSTNTKQLGGLAIAVVVLFVLIWMLIPTKSGYTRLQLLWFTIIGKTVLNSSTGGSGDFGTPPPPTQDVTQTPAGGPSQLPDSNPYMNGTHPAYLNDANLMKSLGSLF